MGFVTHAANDCKVEEVGQDGVVHLVSHRDSAPVDALSGAGAETADGQRTDRAIPNGQEARPRAVTSTGQQVLARQRAAKRRMLAHEADLQADAVC